MIVENQRLTSQIVAAYVRKNLIPTEQIAGLINSVHSTLTGLGNPPVIEEPPRVPAVSVRRSVHAGYIICIECGFKGKMLKRHLQTKHGLSVDQYKIRWNLSSDYPTTAANYSEQRSEFAKKIGLGRAPAPAALPAPAPAAKPEKPARQSSASKTTGTRTSAKKASSQSRSRKPSSKAARKAATAPAGATA
jgi:predicted transcriptional regulator